jgi:hypothetical protein
MSGGILIAGDESALLTAMEAEAARHGQYAVASVPNRFSDADAVPLLPASTDARIPLDWNPCSPISARTLVMAAENRLERIGPAILVCAPPAVFRTAANISFADVEVLVNDHVKGWFFLVKELAARYKSRGEGTLALVFHDDNEASSADASVDFLGSAAQAAFRSIVRSILSVSSNESFSAMGFAGNEAGDEAGFAAFVFKQLEEKNRKGNGRIHKYKKRSFFK